MAKILVNYIHDKSKDEYEILTGAKYVFATEPVAVLNTDLTIKTPLVVQIQGVMQVVDRESFESINKIFKLVSDENGIVKEDPSGVPVWLPKNTDISKLRYINGEIVLIDEEPKNEEQETPVEQKKNKKK